MNDTQNNSCDAETLAYYRKALALADETRNAALDAAEVVRRERDRLLDKLADMRVVISDGIDVVDCAREADIQAAAGRGMVLDTARMSEWMRKAQEVIK